MNNFIKIPHFDNPDNYDWVRVDRITCISKDGNKTIVYFDNDSMAVDTYLTPDDIFDLISQAA